MPTIANVELTEKEVELIRGMLTDDYSDGTVDCSPWSWSVVDGSHSRAGVLSSLQAKGLVNTWGKGRDAVCAFTDEGKVVAAVVLVAVEAEWAAKKAAREAPAAIPPHEVFDRSGRKVKVMVPTD